MNRNKEAAPIHPAVLKAYSVVIAIDYIARKALENPDLTPEQIREIHACASFAQISPKGGKEIFRKALSEFLAVTRNP